MVDEFSWTYLRYLSAVSQPQRNRVISDLRAPIPTIKINYLKSTLTLSEMRGCGRWRRQRLAAFVLLSITGLYLLGYGDNGGKVTELSNHNKLLTRPENEGNVSELIKRLSFANKGPGCHIPRLDPFSADVMEFVEEPPSVDCSLNHTLRFQTNFRNQLLPLGGPTVDGETCCYRVVTRGYGSDSIIFYSRSCHPLSLTKATYIPPEYEFIAVECSRPGRNFIFGFIFGRPITHIDMFAFVPLKPWVEDRISSAATPTRQDDRLSIIILGLDAQSHMNFHRQMPLSHRFLVQNLSAIGLQGYNKVGDNTFPNTVPILTGLSVEQLRSICWPDDDSYFDSCPLIWKSFASAGYRTSFAEDAVWMGAFNYERKGFLAPPTDYYLHPLTTAMEHEIGHQEIGTVHCYGSRLGFEVLLDYLVKTAKTFSDQRDSKRKPYFQLLWSNSLFHDNPSAPKLVDHQLLRTLKYLQNEKLLANTLLIVMSDHGARYGDTYQGGVEDRMPLAYLAFPPRFSAKYSEEMEALKENAKNRLTTPFDIYETLRHMLDIGKGSRNWAAESGFGQSLLVPISKKRGCADAGVEGQWCICDSFLVPIPTNSTLVSDAAAFIVKSINEALQDVCSILSLHRVRRALIRKVEPNQKKDAVSSRTQSIELQLQTMPGEGVFEARVNVEFQQNPVRWKWSLLGGISRLNLYGDDSWCIKDATIEKYCHCKF